MNVSSISMDSVFPLLSVVDDVIISKRGELTMGWELTLPDAFTLSESDYDDLIGAFSSAIRGLPPWTMVHRQDIYLSHSYQGDTEVKGFLNRSFENHFDGRLYRTHHQYLYLTRSSGTSATKSHGAIGLFGLSAVSKLPTPEEIGTFIAKGQEFISGAQSRGHLSVRRLTTEDFLGPDGRTGLIRTVMMHRDTDGVLSDVELSPDCVRTDDSYLVGYTLSDSEVLPGEINTAGKVKRMSTDNSAVYLGFASRIGLELETDHICNTYILKPNQSEALGTIKGRMGRMTSFSKDRGNKINAADIGDYLTAVERDSLTTVYVHSNILAWSEGREGLEAVRSQVSASLSTLGVEAVRDIYDLPVLWYASIPGAGCELGKDNFMAMELDSSLALCQWETFEKGFNEGILKLCDRLRHVPLRLDTMKEAQKRGLIDNGHMFVLGSSGSGKSFFMNQLAYSCYSKGGHVFIIDVGDSYIASSTLVGEESGGVDGIYNCWDLNNPMSFNPLQDYKDWIAPNGAIMRDSYTLDFFLSILKTIWDNGDTGWDEFSERILLHFTKGFLLGWESAEPPIFDDFVKYLHTYLIYPEGEEKHGQQKTFLMDDLLVEPSRFDGVGFVGALDSYAREGAFGALLNERHPKDLFTSRFTVFEVQKLKDTNNAKFYSLCILCIVHSFDRKMRSIPDWKMMVIDEAWQAISNETMAPYLRELWKTARKFNTSAVVVTQELGDIMSSAVIKETILQNSAIKILLNQSTNFNNFEKIAGPLGLSERDRNLIFSMGRLANPRYKGRDIFINWGGKKSGVYCFEPCQEQLLAFESDRTRKAPLLKLQEATGSMVTAITTLAERSREVHKEKKST